MKTEASDLLLHTNFVTMISLKTYFVVSKRCYPYEYMEDLEKINESLLVSASFAKWLSVRLRTKWS